MGPFLNLEGEVCESSPLMLDPVGPISPIADNISTSLYPLNGPDFFPATQSLSWLFKAYSPPKQRTKQQNQFNF